MIHTFPIEELRNVLDEYYDDEEDPRSKTLLSEKATGKTFEDGLVEEWLAIFEHEGTPYRFAYRKGSAHYEAECDPIDPFGHLPYEVKGIDCTVMVARKVVAVTYEKAPETTT